MGNPVEFMSQGGHNAQVPEFAPRSVPRSGKRSAAFFRHHRGLPCLHARRSAGFGRSHEGVGVCVFLTKGSACKACTGHQSHPPYRWVYFVFSKCVRSMLLYSSNIHHRSTQEHGANALYLIKSPDVEHLDNDKSKI